MIRFEVSFSCFFVQLRTRENLGPSWPSCFVFLPITRHKNFRLVQIERGVDNISKTENLKISVTKGRKHSEKVKLLVTSNFSFPHNVFLKYFS